MFIFVCTLEMFHNKRKLQKQKDENRKQKLIDVTKKLKLFLKNLNKIMTII